MYECMHFEYWPSQSSCIALASERAGASAGLSMYME